MYAAPPPQGASYPARELSKATTATSDGTAYGLLVEANHVLPLFPHFHEGGTALQLSILIRCDDLAAIPHLIAVDGILAGVEDDQANLQRGLMIVSDETMRCGNVTTRVEQIEPELHNPSAKKRQFDAVSEARRVA
jgi:hypothetical protein